MDAQTDKDQKTNIVYISGPIRGCDLYRENFSNAEMLLKQKGYDVINPAEVSFVLPDLTHEQYMHIDYALMDLCNAVYFLNGWKDSEGATLEFEYAIKKEMFVMYQK